MFWVFLTIIFHMMLWMVKGEVLLPRRAKCPDFLIVI